MRKFTIAAILFMTVLMALPTASLAGEASARRTYGGATLKEARQAIVRVLKNRDFEPVKMQPERLFFVLTRGHHARLAFTVRLKRLENGRVRISLYGKDKSPHGERYTRKTIRKMEEHILDKVEKYLASHHKKGPRHGQHNAETGPDVMKKVIEAVLRGAPKHP